MGATYTIGNNMLVADFGQGSDSDGSNGINEGGLGDDVAEYDAWRIGAKHNMSKRTFVYAGYVKVDPDESSDIDRFSLGVRHHF